MSTLRHHLVFHDDLPIDTEAADRLLQLGDQFVESWEADQAEAADEVKDADLKERKAEWSRIRPLFAAAPRLLSACVDIALHESLGDGRRTELAATIAEAGGANLLVNAHHEAPIVQDMAGTVVDPLTIAYVAMGAEQAIRECEGGVLPGRVADHFSGQLGFIEEVVKEAWRLDAVARALIENEGGLDGGVFAYEVAEPFGQR